MARNITQIKANRVVFNNATRILFTPWTDESQVGTQSYDLFSIIGDTIGIEQDDPEVNEIPHEFSNEPLFEAVNIGKWKFTADCIDMQNDVLKNLFGWEASADGAYAPMVYKDLYCEVEIKFGDDEPFIVLPKVKMNSKGVFNTLKTGTAKATLQGSAYSAAITSGSDTKETTIAVLPYKNLETYEVKATVAAAASTQKSKI